MCRQFGELEPQVGESPTASTLAIDSDWREIGEHAAIGLAPESATRHIHTDTIKPVAIQPRPGFVLALVWRDDDRSPLLGRVVDFIRQYRDRHGWTENPKPKIG